MSAPFSATRRRTAFVRRSKRRARGSRRACSTAKLMTACGGLPRNTSCAAPASRIDVNRPRSRGSGRSMKVSTREVSCPCRLRTVAAMRRAKPRSLAASSRYSGRERPVASASSNVRPFSSTAVSSSTASSRARRPAGWRRDLTGLPLRTPALLRPAICCQPHGPRVLPAVLAPERPMAAASLCSSAILFSVFGCVENKLSMP